MLSVANNPIMLSVIMLNVIMLSIVAPDIQHNDSLYLVPLCWVSHFINVILYVVMLRIVGGVVPSRMQPSRMPSSHPAGSRIVIISPS